VVSISPRPAYLWETRLRYPLEKSLRGNHSRSGRCGMDKNNFRECNLTLPAYTLLELLQRPLL
jgi:hypothetical protein